MTRQWYGALPPVSLQVDRIWPPDVRGRQASRRDHDPGVREQRVDDAGVEERREVRSARFGQMDAVALKPLRVVTGVRVPVEDRHFRMTRGSRVEHGVHAAELVPHGSQIRPEDALHACGEQCLDRRVDVLRERRLGIVLAEHEHDGRPQIGTECRDEGDQRGRANSVIRAALPCERTADRHLDSEIEALAEKLAWACVPEDRRRDRIADQGDLGRSRRRRRARRRQGHDAEHGDDRRDGGSGSRHGRLAAHRSHAPTS